MPPKEYVIDNDHITSELDFDTVRHPTFGKYKPQWLNFFFWPTFSDTLSAVVPLHSNYRIADCFLLQWKSHSKTRPYAHTKSIDCELATPAYIACSGDKGQHLIDSLTSPIHELPQWPLWSYTHISRQFLIMGTGNKSSFKTNEITRRKIYSSDPIFTFTSPKSL